MKKILLLGFVPISAVLLSGCLDNKLDVTEEYVDEHLYNSAEKVTPANAPFSIWDKEYSLAQVTYDNYGKDNVIDKKEKYNTESEFTQVKIDFVTTVPKKKETTTTSSSSNTNKDKLKVYITDGNLAYGIKSTTKKTDPSKKTNNTHIIYTIDIPTKTFIKNKPELILYRQSGSSGTDPHLIDLSKENINKINKYGEVSDVELDLSAEDKKDLIFDVIFGILKSIF